MAAKDVLIRQADPENAGSEALAADNTMSQNTPPSPPRDIGESSSASDSETKKQQ